MHHEFTAGRGPRGYTRSDERIHEDVCEALTRDADVDATDIEVRISGGEVTLSGHVADREQKRRAEEVAESVAGVRDVFNQIRVAGRAIGPHGNLLGLGVTTEGSDIQRPYGSDGRDEQEISGAERSSTARRAPRR